MERLRYKNEREKGSTRTSSSPRRRWCGRRGRRINDGDGINGRSFAGVDDENTDSRGMRASPEAGVGEDVEEVKAHIAVASLGLEQRRTTAKSPSAIARVSEFVSVCGNREKMSEVERGESTRR